MLLEKNTSVLFAFKCSQKTNIIMAYFNVTVMLKRYICRRSSGTVSVVHLQQLNLEDTTILDTILFAINFRFEIFMAVIFYLDTQWSRCMT